MVLTSYFLYRLKLMMCDVLFRSIIRQNYTKQSTLAETNVTTDRNLATDKGNYEDRPRCGNHLQS